MKEARLQTLMTDFDRLKMTESESIDSYAGKLSGIISKSTALGETIDESKLVKKFLKTLPRSKFIQIVASLEQVLDLKRIGFEDVVGRLKAYEERIREDDGGEDGVKVMFASRSTDDWSGGGGSGSSGGSSGRTKGKGGRSNRSRGFNHDGSAGGSGSNPAQKQNKPNFDDQPNSNKKMQL